MKITDTALERIDRDQQYGKSFRISVYGSVFDGHNIDLIPNTVAQENDVTIEESPSIVMDFAAVNHLTNATIDYDSTTKEIVITT